MSVSVIMTIKNEGDGLRPLLDSLLDQTLPPTEVVICDGGSTDNTLEVLTEYQPWLPLKVIQLPGSNISQGRNAAIAAANQPIIAVTDAGVVLAPSWLEEITLPLRDDKATVVSGWFEPDPYTDFEVVMGVTVLPERRDINPQNFLPSSRSVAFCKSAWEAVQGYPEWLDYSEDLIFDLKLREQFGPFPFTPRAVVYFRPRRSLRDFFWQYYNYAKGDGKANLWPRRHAIRYATYLIGLPVVGWQIWRGRWSGWVLFVTGFLTYCFKPARRLWPATVGWRPPSRLRAFALIPIIRLVGDLAKMIGYPVGILWRLRQPR